VEYNFGSLGRFPREMQFNFILKMSLLFIK
jgi:hypothetical protein